MEKKIHYCWFGGKPLPKKVKACIKTWKKYLPDYEIIEWNEKNFDINVCPFVKQAYENKKWAFVSDYARIYALYKEGGIYFDTDVKVLKDITHILDKDMFFGYEDSGFVGTAVIGTKEKNNKYVKEILDYYNKLEEFNPDIMYNYANPVIITKILKKYKSKTDADGIEVVDNSVYIYPRDYFFPLSYNYAEREFTENTCMVHLFNATWTSRGERRTINIYRKFGPKFGKILNSSINKIGDLKSNFKKSLINIYKSLRMFYSIHLNRKKRVNKIEQEIKDKKGGAILICNPDNAYENQYLNSLFDNNVLYLREQYTEKEAKMIAKLLNTPKFHTIIFNSLSMGWDNLLLNIKKENRNIKIKVIIHGGNEQIINANIWYTRDRILELYAKRTIDEFIIFNKYLFEFYKNKGYKVSFINRKVEIDNSEKYKNNENKHYIKIGMYINGYDVSNNVYNQLAAISLLDQSKLDFNPLNYEIAMFARRFNINITGDSNALSQEELYFRIAKNDVILCINLIDNDSLIPLQSLELGVPCLIGNGSKYFENSELEKYIKIEDSENISEICNKISYVIENRQKIISLYQEWKKDNNK